MSRLTREFFAYVWAWYRLADLNRRGAKARQFNDAVLALAGGRHLTDWPMTSANTYGEWAGCAWYRAKGLNELADGIISDPAKNLFAERKNIVLSTSGFITKKRFIALESDGVSLGELLHTAGLAREGQDCFNLDVRTLAYRGPVLIGWQHFGVAQKATSNVKGTAARQPLRRSRRKTRTEKIYWLGILPRNALDLKELWVRKLLATQPEARALLLRNAFRLFLTNSLSNLDTTMSADPRVIARALAYLHGGEPQIEAEHDFVSDVDLGDGRRSYLFVYEKKLQPVTTRVLTEMADDGRFVWYAAKPTNEAVPEIMATAKTYAGKTPILAFSADMAVALQRRMPWVWHQRANDLRTIRARTDDDREAQINMLTLAAALHAFSGSHFSVGLLRKAWPDLGTTGDFDVTFGHLADAGLLSFGAAGKDVIFGTVLSPEAFVASEALFARLTTIVEWIWTTPKLSDTERGWLLQSAVWQLRRLQPAYGTQLYERWRNDFPNHQQVLLADMWGAIHEERWSDMRSAIRRLVAIGERDMIDVAMKQVFTGTLAEQRRIDALLAAAEATLETGRGTSYAVNALLRDYEQPEVAAFLRAAFERGSGNLYLVLRDLSSRDPKLPRFVLDIAAQLPMDDMTREQFDAASRRTLKTQKPKSRRS